MSRFARRKDRNHEEVVGWFQQHNASVLVVESGQAGVIDLLVGYLGVDQTVEVKPVTGITRERELRASQVEWHSKWKGRKPVVVRTLEDVQRVLSSIRAGLTSSEAHHG